jgi:HAD superfamily hydrolase (TIGR01490 family)
MNLALFDFDGTITYRDSFSLFVKYSVPKSKLIRGYLILAPFIIGYRFGLVSGTQLRRKIVSIGYKGEALACARRLGQAYAQEIIPGMVREEALKRIQWHLDQGDKVVIVSASLDLYLEPWCKKYGLDLICSRLETKGDRLTGAYDRGDCTADEKKARVLAAYDLKKYDKVYAYGDTEEDRELLQLADVRFFRWKEISDE